MLFIQPASHTVSEDGNTQSTVFHSAHSMTAHQVQVVITKPVGSKRSGWVLSLINPLAAGNIYKQAPEVPLLGPYEIRLTYSFRECYNYMKWCVIHFSKVVYTYKFLIINS